MKVFFEDCLICGLTEWIVFEHDQWFFSLDIFSEEVVSSPDFIKTQDLRAVFLVRSS